MIPFTTRTRLVVVEPPDGERFIATQIVSPSNGNPVSFDRMHTRGLNAKGSRVHLVGGAA